MIYYPSPLQLGVFYIYVAVTANLSLTANISLPIIYADPRPHVTVVSLVLVQQDLGRTDNLMS